MIDGSEKRKPLVEGSHVIENRNNNLCDKAAKTRLVRISHSRIKKCMHC